MKRYLFRIITLVCVKMMIPSFLFAGTVFNANAQKITLVYEQVELHKILEEVKRLTSYDFIYKPENIDGGKKVSLDIREENLEPALKKIVVPVINTLTPGSGFLSSSSTFPFSTRFEISSCWPFCSIMT